MVWNAKNPENDTALAAATKLASYIAVPGPAGENPLNPTFCFLAASPQTLYSFDLLNGVGHLIFTR